MTSAPINPVHEAALAAEALGATALAMWAHGQAEVTAGLAEKELTQPGYAVSWERKRKAQREQQQALLVAEARAKAVG